MFKALKKYPILVICLFVAVMLLPNLDALQISIMEARNFITAREMITNDHWLLTTMNNVARYQKPPLPAWFSALGSILFGTKSLFGMRLPAVLMVMLAGSFMYYLSRTILKSRAHSIINALVLITSFYVIGITFEAPSDIFTHAFMLVTIYYFYENFKIETTNWRYAVYSGIFLGLSILSKGPVSIYALLIPFLIAYGFSFKYKNIKQKLPYILSAIVLGLAIGSSWYLYVKLKDPNVLNSTVAKETGTWKSYNVRPFYYYWSFFTQSGLWTIPAFISLLYPYLKNRVSHYKAYKFSLLWTIIAVILLSVIPMKKSRYLMPVLIPLAFNIGFYIDYLIRKFKVLKDKRETLPVYFNFGLIGILGIAFPVVMFVLFKAELQNHLLTFIIASIVLFVIGVLILFQLKAKDIKNVFLLTVLFFASVFIFVLPLSKAFKNENFSSLSSLNEENQQRSIKLYAINYIAPETIWDYGNVIPEIRQEAKGYVFPLENKFGILVYKMSAENEAEIRANYEVEEMTTYDLNYFGSASNQNNPRLKSVFYILTKK
ncbi:glycosyltransferase family 39 protein [Lacinutrix sp. Bg11-31]|uniref:ArnT family glycosyltransferase n=1 Tax=Lacinutrix sp. Bg11-31 TaxID=2057808 RepID=UPI000C30F899|nr:glycosyltransferase family 39 protein [Lacinutrix sp. Bg11-31]AUC82110.1 glycosyltransferase [Lacinutrix sp. Bg11-31]